MNKLPTKELIEKFIVNNNYSVNTIPIIRQNLNKFIDFLTRENLYKNNSINFNKLSENHLIKFFDNIKGSLYNVQRSYTSKYLKYHLMLASCDSEVKERILSFLNNFKTVKIKKAQIKQLTHTQMDKIVKEILELSNNKDYYYAIKLIWQSEYKQAQVLRLKSNTIDLNKIYDAKLRDTIKEITKNPNKKHGYLFPVKRSNLFNIFKKALDELKFSNDFSIKSIPKMTSSNSIFN